MDLSEEKKEIRLEETPKPPPKRRRRSKPKTEDIEGLGLAGNPEKYQEARENKYAPKEKIGKPTLGRSPNYVERIGLGNLRVISNGNDGTIYRP